MTNSQNLSIDSSRFGTVQVSLDRLLTFPEGLIGFGNRTRYVLLDHPGRPGPFQWLQSAEQVDLAFPVVDPRLVIPDYVVEVHPRDIDNLVLANAEAARVIVVATLPANAPGEIWLNLRGPLVINPANGMGKQLALMGDQYPLRYRLKLGDSHAVAHASPQRKHRHR